MLKYKYQTEERMSENNNSHGSGGICLFTVVAIVLAVLKLTGTISIGWGTIIAIWFAPSIIAVLIGLISLIIIFLVQRN